MINKALCLLAAVGLLASCATPTPYQPATSQGGYSEMALSKDMYEVTFHGNELTTSQTVNNYMLRRCAELTASKGYKYFIKMDNNTAKSTTVVQTPTTVNTYGTNSKDSYSIVNNGESIAVDSYTTTATIKMLNSNQKYPSAYDAKVVLSNFRS